MALNIKDPETELFVRILARRRGVTLTEAVRQAANSELDSDALPEPEKARRIAGGQRWLDNFYKKYAVERPVRTMTKQEMNDIVDAYDNGAPSRPIAASAKAAMPASLNMGDCAAYALAKARGWPLLFKGDDFSQTDVERA